MKRIAFFLFFTAMQIAMIFCAIHKNMRFIQYSFTKQKLERHYQALIQEKTLLTQQLYILQDPSEIKKFSQESLDLTPINIAQIRRITP